MSNENTIQRYAENITPVKVLYLSQCRVPLWFIMKQAGKSFMGK
jgi:predicted metal-binding membrane protein